jgi:hypothetical protein
MKIPYKLINLGVKLLPSLKSAVFSDGIFKPTRAAYLIAFFIVLAITYTTMGPEATADVVELLDDVSDVIGYAE